MIFSMLIGNRSRRVPFYLVILLLLPFVLLAGNLPSAQAQTIAYVMMGSRNVNLHEGWGHAHFDVDRLLIGMSHASGKSFKVCFTGSATPGTDFHVYQSYTRNAVTLSGNCFTDTWGSGDWLAGAKKRYSVMAVKDNVSDPNETIIATVSEHNNSWGGAYTLIIPSTKLTIRGG